MVCGAGQTDAARYQVLRWATRLSRLASGQCVLVLQCRAEVEVNLPAVVSCQPVPLQHTVLTGEAIRELVAYLVYSLQQQQPQHQQQQEQQWRRHRSSATSVVCCHPFCSGTMHAETADVAEISQNAQYAHKHMFEQT